MTLGKAAAGARRRGGGTIRIAADEVQLRRVFQRTGTSATLVLAGAYTGAASAVAARVIAADTSAEVVPWTVVSGGPGGSGEDFTDATGSRPVAWWMFTESAGNRASSAGASDALVPSASVPALTTGPHGGSAVDFIKASSQQLSLAESGMSAGFPGRSTLTNGSLTVGAWIRIDSETGNDAGILGKDTNYQLVVQNGVVQFRIFSASNAASVVSADTAAYTAGTWRHYVGRYTQSTGEVVLFVNGIRRTAATTASRNVSANPFLVGIAATTTNFDGAVGELFVFDTALTDAQVASIYNAGLNGARTSSAITTPSEFSSEFSTEFQPPSSAVAADSAEYTDEFTAEYTVDAAGSPGSWTGALSVPQGGWYKLQYRLATEPAGVLTATNIFGVGDIWMFAGESQQARMSSLANTPPTADSRTVYLNAGPTWDLPGVVAGTSGNGVIRFLNLMRSATGVPQACIQVAVEGTSITDWESGDPAYATAAARLGTVGAIAGFLWHQGGTGIGVVTRTDYKTRLAALRAAIQGAGTVQRFAVFPLMHRLNAADTDLATHEARRAHFEYISENPGTIDLGWVPDVPLGDDVIQTAAGSELIAYSYAHALLYAMGAEPTTSAGPVITSASRSGTSVTLNVQHRGGTGLKLNSGTVATGFQVLARGAPHSDAGALALSGVTLGTNTITLALAANPNSAVDVYYQYGRFDATSPVHDNTTALGRTTGNALKPLMMPVQTPAETGQLTNQALKLDGTTGLLRYSDTAAWDLPDADWTLGMFLRIDSNAGSSDQYFFSTGNYGALNTYNFLINEASSGAANRFEANVRGAGATSFTAQGPVAAALADNQWRLWIVERVKATETLNIYYCNINGTRTLYHTISVTGLGAIQPTVGAALGTRAPQAAGSGIWLDGAMSYFFSMSGLLTADDVRRLAGGNDLMTDVGKSPSVYTKLNTLTSPILNSGSGGTASASIIGGVTLTGGPVFTVSTTAVQFDEASTIYTMPDSASFDMPDNDWTLGFFLAVDNNDGTVSQHIWSTGGYLAPHCINILFYENGSTRPDCFGIGMEGSGAVDVEIVAPTAASTFDGAYRLWTVERDKATNRVNIYYTPVNGVRVLHHSELLTVTLGTISPTTAVMTLGCRNANATPTGRYFGGRMYMAFQMDGKLTQIQTQDIARGRDPITDVGATLKWYHKLTDTAATRTDLSGNGNTATLSGTAVQVAGPLFTPNA